MSHVFYFCIAGKRNVAAEGLRRLVELEVDWQGLSCEWNRVVEETLKGGGVCDSRYAFEWCMWSMMS